MGVVKVIVREMDEGGSRRRKLSCRALYGGHNKRPDHVIPRDLRGPLKVSEITPGGSGLPSHESEPLRVLHVT